jgi:hypothetical protein
VAATFEPREGADRFDTHFTPLSTTAGLLEAFAIHPEWRYERAAETAARARERLAERVDVVTEPGHSTLISFRMDDPEDTVKRLAENAVIVRDLPGTGLVRVSCGWWTSDEGPRPPRRRALERREEVDHVAVRVADLRIALVPERVTTAPCVRRDRRSSARRRPGRRRLPIRT